MREILETPESLEEKVHLQQEVVPYLGLGFKKVRLPREVFDLLRGSMARNLANFRPEGEETYIQTMEENTASSLVHEDTDLNP